MFTTCITFNPTALYDIKTGIKEKKFSTSGRKWGKMVDCGLKNSYFYLLINV